MIYLIGGPGRSGKTSLARHLMKAHSIPFSSLDYLMMGLYHGAPSLEVDPNQAEAVIASKMWPVCKPMLTAMLENGETYCVEGFAITPHRVAELRDRFPDRIRACFLGYCTASAVEKWDYERPHPTTNAWDMKREEAMAEFELMKRASLTLRQECADTGYRFFDTSEQFEDKLLEAGSYLMEA